MYGGYSYGSSEYGSKILEGAILFISVVDTEIENDILENVELISHINVFDIDTESDVIVDIEIINFISVVDTETESELITIKIPTLGIIYVIDSETELEYVTIGIVVPKNIGTFDVYSIYMISTIGLPSGYSPTPISTRNVFPKGLVTVSS